VTAVSAAAPAPDDDRIPTIIRALINVMPLPAIEEVLDALRRRLYAVQSAQAWRASELGLLRGLLIDADRGLCGADLPYVSSAKYDAAWRAMETDDVPSTSSLRDRYGSWVQACLAAASVGEDGELLGPWTPWRHGMLGRRGYRVTADDATLAIRLCATSTGIRRPTAHQYNEWRNAHAAIQRRAGATPSIPTQRTVYRLLSSSNGPRGQRWRQILHKALDDEELTDNEECC